jgi:membrane protease YdiL (CAAX protease family)
MSKLTPRQVAICLAVILAFLVPYSVGWAWGWWKFAGTTTLIVLLWRWARPEDFTADLGIRVRRTDLMLAISTLLVVGIGAGLLIPVILRQHGYVPGHTNPLWMFLALPFQTLNEEMVLRALLLTVLANILKIRILLSIGLAGLFALVHLVLYRFGPPHSALSFQALTVVFLVGFAFNEFFQATGSIAIPWAIHLGWNLTRFGRDWIGQGTAGTLEQGRDFNLVEGNPWVILLAVALVLIASAARFRRLPQRVCAGI